MSADLTPREYLALEQHNIKNGHDSILAVLGSITVNHNGQNYPYMTSEELTHRKAFPLLGKLLNDFEEVYATFSNIEGGLDFLGRKDTELSIHIETGKGNLDSVLLRWFDGKLYDGYYGDKSNDQHFLNILSAEATLSQESVNITQLAQEIDQFAYDQDYYEYGDQVEDRAAHVSEIEEQLVSGRVTALTDYFISFIEEADPSAPSREEALRLVAQIDRIASESLEQLAELQVSKNREGKGVQWFALDDDKCISVWYAPDKYDGDQFQMHLEKRRENGSMGPGCEVLSDESYGTSDISHASLSAVLREICGDAGIFPGAQIDRLADDILSVFEIRRPSLSSIISATEQKVHPVSKDNNRSAPER